MAFRDDREALRARLDAVEAERDALRRENEALRSERRAPAGPGVWFLGAPTKLRLERSTDGELREEDHEHLVEALRARFGGLGQVSRVGRSFAWSLGPPASARVVEVSASSRRGRTVLRATEQLGNLAGAVFGGIVGGLGGGGIGFIAPAFLLWRAPGLIPLGAVAWIGLVYLAVRFGYRAAVRARAAELDACLDELESIATAARDAPDRARVRVGTERDGPAEVDAVDTAGPDADARAEEARRAGADDEAVGPGARGASRRGPRR